MLGHWNLALHLLKSHETELSKKLIERMTLREEALLSPPVLAGTYLDPEYQVLLTESQKEIAKIELQSVHQRIVLLDSKKSTSSSDCGESSRARIPVDMAGSQTCEVSLSPMQKMLQAKQKGKIEISNSSGTMQAIRLINSFDHHEPTNVSSVFEFWKNHDIKTLSKLAKVVIALPTTQVSVERLFSGIKYIMSQGWRTYGTRATSGTRGDFHWHGAFLIIPPKIVLRTCNQSLCSRVKTQVRRKYNHGEHQSSFACFLSLCDVTAPKCKT